MVNLISPPKHRCLCAPDTAQTPRDAQLLLYHLEATIQIVAPAIMHQIMVTKVLSEVYLQPEIDKGKVKAAAVVRVNGTHTPQGPQ